MAWCAAVKLAASYLPDAGVLRASQHSLTAGAVPLAAGSGEFRPNVPPEQQLCAANAGGLTVSISEIGRHPVMSVVTLFVHHLRLLGTNPANWTKVPIG